MKKKLEQYVWIIDMDWKNIFYAKRVLKHEADNVNIRQFKTKAAARSILTIYEPKTR